MCQTWPKILAPPVARPPASQREGLRPSLGGANKVLLKALSVRVQKLIKGLLQSFNILAMEFGAKISGKLLLFYTVH